MFLTDSSLNHDTATATSCSIFCHTRFTSARMRSRTGAPPGDTTTCANVPPAVPRDKRPGLITTTGAALTAATHLRCPNTWLASAGNRSTAVPGGTRLCSLALSAFRTSAEQPATTSGPIDTVDGFWSATAWRRSRGERNGQQIALGKQWLRERGRVHQLWPLNAGTHG
ncbi:hypothetical protein Vafri_14702 [Volvox africanus]|uniref:Uncharacterized protein n=1 Tax=Volvox africanus TaxID=51714 RepID=A0A8J4BEW7_9CHLO|nr:hypothetical protein Vafri_14702 [Volvox africanus]